MSGLSPPTKTMGADLDGLIHSIEYENQAFVKMIEKENQRVVYLESEEEEKNTAIALLQADIKRLEAETKSSHKQLVHNKETLQSLKSSRSVLQAHLDALGKQLDMLQFENREQKQEFGETLQNYSKTWCEYEGVYKAMSLYKILVEEEARLLQLLTQHSAMQKQKSELQQKIKVAQDELDFQDWTKFCIRLAEKRRSIEGKKGLLRSVVKDNEKLRAKLREIRTKNASSLCTTPLDASQDLEMGNEGDSEQTAAVTPAQNMETGQANEENKETSDGDESDKYLDDTFGGGGDAVTGNTKGNAHKEQDAGTCDGTLVANTQCISATAAEGETLFQHQSDLSTYMQEITDKETEQMEEDSTVGSDNFQRPAVFHPTASSTPVVTSSQMYTGSQPSTPKRPTLQALTMPRMGVPVATRSTSEPRRASVPLVSLPSLYLPKSTLSKVPSVKSAVSCILSAGSAPKVQAPKPSFAALPQIKMPKTPLLTMPPSPRPTLPAPSPVLSAALSTASLLPPAPVIAPPPPPPRLDPPSGFAFPQAPRLVPPPLPVVCMTPQSPRLLPPKFNESDKHGRDRESKTRNITAAPVESTTAELPLMRSSAPQEVTMRASNVTSSKPIFSATGVPVSLAGHHSGPPTSPHQKSGSPRQLPSPLAIASASGDAPAPSKDGSRAGFPADTVEDMEFDVDIWAGSSAGSSQGSVCAFSQGSSQSPGSQEYFQESAGVVPIPFDTDKHQQKLMELRSEEDTFCFIPPKPFAVRTSRNSTESRTSVSSNETASQDNSIFNMAFAVPSETTDQPKAPYFASPLPPKHKTKKLSPPSCEERSGSFFAFDAMDTGDSGGGLSLLSIFGGGSDAVRQEDSSNTFSFNFDDGVSSGSKGGDSGFSFSFGGGGGESTSNSIFSLF